MEAATPTRRERPRAVTSRRSIRYRASAWSVHEFEVVGAAGQPLCGAAALRTGGGALLLWAGEPAGPARARLAAAALAVPHAGAAALLGGGEAAATAAQLARHLSARLARPVHVCTGAAFDRFTLPLIERGLLREIESRPEYF